MKIGVGIIHWSTFLSISFQKTLDKSKILYKIDKIRKRRHNEEDFGVSTVVNSALKLRT